MRSFVKRWTRLLQSAVKTVFTWFASTLTKKGFNTILGDLVIKPEGKPTLVEESDAREPMNRTGNAFKDIIDNI